MCEEGVILTGHYRRMRVVYSRLRAVLEDRCSSRPHCAGRQAPSARFPRARRMRPKQQQARETINPVTGLIHQARKCLAAGVAAYIVRRSWRAAKQGGVAAKIQRTSKAGLHPIGQELRRIVVAAEDRMTTWHKRDWQQFYELARRPWQRHRPPRPVYPTGINRVLPTQGFSLSELDDAGVDLDLAERLGLPVDAGRIGAYGPNVTVLRDFVRSSRQPL